MKRTLQLHERPSPDHRGAVVLCLAVLILLCLSYPSGSRAQAANEKTFSTPGDAALALYKAAKSDDSSSLKAIFGSNADKDPAHRRRRGGQEPDCKVRLSL